MKTQLQTISPQNMTELMAFCDLISKSNIVPKALQGHPANVMVAVQMGQAVGVDPMMALQNIAVIDGKPKFYGDITLALAQSHPAYEYVKSSFDEKTQTATYTAKRRNHPEQSVSFSAEDAKNMGLLARDTYKKDLATMLFRRAQQRCLYRVFADVLYGIAAAPEELDNLEPEQISALVIDADEQLTTDKIISMIESAQSVGEISHVVEMSTNLPTEEKTQANKNRIAAAMHTRHDALKQKETA
jgi:hypothetical protein